jgi:hypothetical protein
MDYLSMLAKFSVIYRNVTRKFGRDDFVMALLYKNTTNLPDQGISK